MILRSQICVIEMKSHVKIDQDTARYSPSCIQDGETRGLHGFGFKRIRGYVSKAYEENETKVMNASDENFGRGDH